MKGITILLLIVETSMIIIIKLTDETSQTLAIISLNDQNNTLFYVDLGATSHMTNDTSILFCTKSYDDTDVSLLVTEILCPFHVLMMLKLQLMVVRLN